MVWHDGSVWRSALDTTDFFTYTTAADGAGAAAAAGSSSTAPPPGSLELFEPLASFAVEHKFGTMSAADACNFAANVYDGGSVLSIVIDAGPHGTHVAGIVAAHHPEARARRTRIQHTSKVHKARICHPVASLPPQQP